MKRLIKKLIPTVLLDYKSKWFYSPAKSKYKNLPMKQTFTEIFQSNEWGNEQSVSGQGSSLEQTQQAIDGINQLIQDYSITSILDIPCGDMNWMRHVNLHTINYLGGDIVDELIRKNNALYAGDNIHFKVMNLVEDSLEQVDLIIVRDCFVHFSYENILHAVQQIKKSKSIYLLCTNFSDAKINYDVVSGDWRPINLRLKPFCFPQPILIIEEAIHQKFKRDFRGKSLTLWKIEDLPDF